MKVLVSAALLTALTLTGCQSQEKKPYAQAPDPEKRSALAAIDNAKAHNKAAQKAGFEWRDTGKLIKQAEAMIAEGKFAKAQTQAIQAYYQADIALKQAKTSAGAGNPSYLYQ